MGSTNQFGKKKVRYRNGNGNGTMEVVSAFRTEGLLRIAFLEHPDPWADTISAGFSPSNFLAAGQMERARLEKMAEEEQMRNPIRCSLSIFRPTRFPLIFFPVGFELGRPALPVNSQTFISREVLNFMSRLVQK